MVSINKKKFILTFEIHKYFSSAILWYLFLIILYVYWYKKNLKKFLISILYLIINVVGEHYCLISTYYLKFVSAVAHDSHYKFNDSTHIEHKVKTQNIKFKVFYINQMILTFTYYYIGTYIFSILNKINTSYFLY